MVYNTDDIEFALNLLQKTRRQKPLILHFVEDKPNLNIIQSIQDHFKFAENFASSSMKDSMISNKTNSSRGGKM